MARVGMADLDVLKRFRRVVGFGQICGPYPGYREGYKQRWEWNTRRHDHTAQLVALFWPWLGERRRERARHALVANRQRPAMQTHKLSPTIATLIRGRYAAGELTQEQLAAEYGVCTSTISNIVRRKVYKHVP